VLAGSVETSKAAAGLARLLAVLEEDATAGPDLKTFTVARWEAARAFNTYIATSDSVFSALMFSAYLNLPPQAWDAYPVRGEQARPRPGTQWAIAPTVAFTARR